MHLRPFTRDDIEAARALLVSLAAERLPYVERPLELLDAAAGAGAGEYRALVAGDASGTAGLAIFGPVAGSLGAGVVYCVAVAPARRRAGVGSALLEGALSDLAAAGARLAVVELPDDAALDDVRALLRARGFVEETRVRDLVRDGVAMTFWRRELAAA